MWTLYCRNVAEPLDGRQTNQRAELQASTVFVLFVLILNSLNQIAVIWMELPQQPLDCNPTEI